MIGFENVEIDYRGQNLLHPNITTQGYVLINDLNRPGFYTSLNSTIKHQVSYNVNKDEISSKRMSEHELEEVFNKQIVFIDKTENTKDLINSSRKGKEIWRYFLYLLIFFVCLEMIISNGNQPKKTV